MNETAVNYLSTMLEQCELTINEFALIIDKPIEFVISMLDGKAVIDRSPAVLLSTTIGPSYYPEFWQTKANKS